ncbi:hypothetical protein HGRIS_000608 [Hohenbuehelia grisea]|uniref:DUF6533 domain-containing protein n=1 Tax=Hohenbuehelia grisea TaxID=104357 RepID=A0ABR3JRP8_9AGAR
MSNNDIDLISWGIKIFSYQLFLRATASLVIINYILTLPDEIKFVWKSTKGLSWWAFMLSRYYSILVIIATTSCAFPFPKLCQ